jgi:hypothetical protein
MAKKPSEKELTEKTKKRIQKLLKKGHSPAGAKFKATASKGWSKPKKKGEAVYFKGIRKQSTAQGLKVAGLSAQERKVLGIK